MRPIRVLAHVASVFAMLFYVVLAGTYEFMGNSTLPNFLPASWREHQFAAFQLAFGALAGAVVYALICSKLQRRLTPLGVLAYGTGGAILEWFFLKIFAGGQGGPGFGWMWAVLLGAFGIPTVVVLIVLLIAWGLAALAGWFRERRAPIKAPLETPV